MLSSRNIASARIEDLATGGPGNHAAVKAVGDCTAPIGRRRQAPARLAQRDVIDLRAVVQERRAHLDRAPR